VDVTIDVLIGSTNGENRRPDVQFFLDGDVVDRLLELRDAIVQIDDFDRNLELILPTFNRSFYALRSQKRKKS